MVTEKVYNTNEVISFSKISGTWGRFSNMFNNALFVNETFIPSAEALYQSCKYPLYPEIQKEIIDQDNGMKAKKISRAYTKYERQDWETIKFSVMRWTLMVKLLQDWDNLSTLLDKTKDLPIVEISSKDTLWGAVRCAHDKLVGRNILGRLLMDIRNKYVLTYHKPDFVPPLQIPSFQLFGVNIGRVFEADYYNDFLAQ